MTEREIPLERKLKILADAAKYDVAVLRVGQVEEGRRGISGIRYLRVSVIHFLPMDGVFLF